MGSTGKTVTTPDTVAVVSVGLPTTMEELSDASIELAEAAMLVSTDGTGVAAEMILVVAGRGMMTGVIGNTVTTPVGCVGNAV